MARTFYKSAWGSVRIWLSKISTQGGRKLLVQEYSRGDVPDTRDRGDVPLVVRCSMLFDDFVDTDEDPQDRLEALIALKQKGEPQLFTHPLSVYGTYLAAISDFDHEVSDSGVITAEATFTATEAVGSIAGDAIGISHDIGAGATDASTAELLAQLEDSDTTSDLPAVAAAAAGVLDNSPSARAVLVSISNVSERVHQQIDDLQVAADIELWPLLKAYVMLGDAYRDAGARAMGDVPLMTLRVDGPTSLRRLVAEIYGAGEASDRYEEARSLNDIPTPGRIPTGTQLRLHQPKRAA